MKTDRELLELAAKADGRHLLAGHPDDVRGVFTTLGWWNPLTNDGDALRMAVKLNLTCRFYYGNSCAQATTPGGTSAYEDVYNPTDHMAGARAAIVRAAAAIGGEMS